MDDQMRPRDVSSTDAGNRSAPASDPEPGERQLDVVIVGGGPTGVELAGGIRELYDKVLAKDFPELDARRAQIERRLDEAADILAETLIDMWRKEQRAKLDAARGGGS